MSTDSSHGSSDWHAERAAGTSHEKALKKSERRHTEKKYKFFFKHGLVGKEGLNGVKPKEPPPHPYDRKKSPESAKTQMDTWRRFKGN